ncbi:MAG: hypothetical protein WA948_11465 [Pontixanthobacter sp.]
MPARFLPPEFTLAELHRVYEITVGEAVNVDAFRRKAVARAFLSPTGHSRRASGANRPSALYRLNAAATVFDRRF